MTMNEKMRKYRLPNPSTPEDLEMNWSKILTFGDKVLLTGYHFNGASDKCWLNDAPFLAGRSSDSGHFTKKAKNKAGGDLPANSSRPTRYDYFETRVNIGGKNYAVSFDVEVHPSNNKYRTHTVSKLTIEEMDAKKSRIPAPC